MTTIAEVPEMTSVELENSLRQGWSTCEETCATLNDKTYRIVKLRSNLPVDSSTEGQCLACIRTCGYLGLAPITFAFSLIGCIFCTSVACCCAQCSLFEYEDARKTKTPLYFAQGHQPIMMPNRPLVENIGREKWDEMRQEADRKGVSAVACALFSCEINKKLYTLMNPCSLEYEHKLVKVEVESVETEPKPTEETALL